jgi:hypothetical protein
MMTVSSARVKTFKTILKSRGESVKPFVLKVKSGIAKVECQPLTVHKKAFRCEKEGRIAF